MKIIEYNNIKETVFQEIFDNGLNLKIIPKKGYKKTFVCLGTNYGSLTNRISRNAIGHCSLFRT